jgi:SAM-dependent methyltransferase
MDKTTLAAYDADPGRYAADWDTQPPPDDLYEQLRAWFTPGPTAEIGSGSGRDAAWLAAQGFDVHGFDASEGLLAHARAAHPGIPFEFAALPELAGVARGAWQNVLCETVIMHLDAAQVAPSVRTLLALLRPGGTLYLSWRVTEDASTRDPAGRLYAAFDKSLVTNELATGDTIVFDEDATSVASGKRLQRLVIRRAAA